MAGLGRQSNRFCDEKLRLGTFTNYPQNAPVRPVRLAEEGFFYCEDIAAVTCFRCGFQVTLNTLQSLRVPDCDLHFCSRQVPSRRNIPMIASPDAPNTMRECLERQARILARLHSTSQQNQSTSAILNACVPQHRAPELRPKMSEDHNHLSDASCDNNLRRQGGESGSLVTRSKDDMSVSGAVAPSLSSHLSKPDIFPPMDFLSGSVRRRSSSQAAPQGGLDGQGTQNQAARPYLNPDLARADFLISGSGESVKCFLSGNGNEAERKRWTPIFGGIPKPRRPPSCNDVLGDADVPEEIKDLKKRIRKIEEQRLCKVCDAVPFEIIFLPCGHLVCCQACASQLLVCPMCARPIRSIVPVVPNE